MDELAELTYSGWSWYVGWSLEYRRFIARAWRPLKTPKRLQSGVVTFLECYSACGSCVAEAAAKCAEIVRGKSDG